MPPVSPVFHTVVAVRIGLKIWRTEIGMLEVPFT